MDPFRADPTDAPMDDEPPSPLAMIAIVAVVVAITILVFFALGYVFGRIFL